MQKSKLREEHEKITREILEETKAQEKAAARRPLMPSPRTSPRTPMLVSVSWKSKGHLRRRYKAQLRRCEGVSARCLPFSVDKARGKVTHVNHSSQDGYKQDFLMQTWIPCVQGTGRPWAVARMKHPRCRYGSRQGAEAMRRQRDHTRRQWAACNSTLSLHL